LRRIYGTPQTHPALTRFAWLSIGTAILTIGLNATAYLLTGYEQAAIQHVLSGYSAPHLQFHRMARGNARFPLTQLMQRSPQVIWEYVAQ